MLNSTEVNPDLLNGKQLNEFGYPKKLGSSSLMNVFETLNNKSRKPKHLLDSSDSEAKSLMLP